MHPLRQRQHLVACPVDRTGDQELIPADAPDHVRAAGGGLQRLRRQPDGLVPCLVAVAVVAGLQPVQVDEQGYHGGPPPGGA